MCNVFSEMYVVSGVCVLTFNGAVNSTCSIAAALLKFLHFFTLPFVACHLNCLAV